MDYTLIALALTVGPVFALLGLLHLWRHFFYRQRKKSPITRDLLRPPGSHARANIDELNWDLATWASELLLVPGVMVALVYANALDRGEFSPIVVAGAAGLAAVIWGVSIRKLLKGIKERRNWTLGLEAELAVAQELDLLMLDGYRVFHDFPAENFNIDHIVIGKNGVFAVETKGRPKPVSREGRGQWKVAYDGRSLMFPGHREVGPIEQAKLQANWLAKWLSGAVGERTAAAPVLMLPGWYIERVSGTGIPVLNGKNNRKLFPQLRGGALSEAHMQRIAFQVEAKCRDQRPRAYGLEKS